MRVMAAGLAVVVRRLFDEGRLDGILGMGGSGGTSIATTAMRALPVGVPKVWSRPWAAATSAPTSARRTSPSCPRSSTWPASTASAARIYANAAGAIAGMVQMEAPAGGDDKPLITASMFGNTTECVNACARALLEQRATRSWSSTPPAPAAGRWRASSPTATSTASLDITTTELADKVCGGVFDAGPDRLHGRRARRHPAPDRARLRRHGELRRAARPCPAKYRRAATSTSGTRKVTLMRTNVEENRTMGEMLRRSGQRGHGPVPFLLPLRGVSILDSAGQPVLGPRGRRAPVRRDQGRTCRPGIPVDRDGRQHQRPASSRTPCRSSCMLDTA